MKYSCSMCGKQYHPCVIDIKGIVPEAPYSCPYANDRTEVKADWKEMKEQDFEMNGVCSDCSNCADNCDNCKDAAFFDNAKSKEECKFSHDDFNVLLQDWLVRIKSILGQKAGEYAQDGERLFNFRLAAKINGQTMPQALWGMATKHLVSVMDLVEGRLQPTPEIVEEKCTDLVNYIILLSAVLYDENKK